MEAELLMDFPDSKIELIRGSGGVFDIKCDGKLIYSKQETSDHSFPAKGLVTRLIRDKSK
ncbi:MAG: hypothetical protein EPN93_02160 [Spirochaetes bacterium]|nr:MAG: hypothetical protein EPN93_02160 [Spirochaetota bacterium]